MAKKKKNTVPEQLNLSSNVVLKILNGKSVVKTIKTHNIVMLNLMYGMLVALSGSVNKNYCPNYLAVGSGSTPSPSVTRETLVQEIGLSRVKTTPNYKGMPKKGENSVSTIYQALIPYTNVGGLPIKEIGLFGTATEASLLARIELKQQLNLLIGQSLMIEWSFSLENKPATSTQSK